MLEHIGNSMALHPEVKQLRKEKRALVRIIEKKDEEIQFAKKINMLLRISFYEAFLKDRIERLLEKRQTIILCRRWGFYDGIPKSLEEVGKEFDITRERVRQIEEKAISILAWKK